MRLKWLQHAFAPAATFINLKDERYTQKIEPHQPGSILLFNLTGINNNAFLTSGTVKLKLLDLNGKSVSDQTLQVKLPSYLRIDIPVSLTLPDEA